MMRVNSSPAHIPVAPDLSLRLVTMADAHAVYHLIDTHRAYLREWLPFIDYSQSVADTKAYFRTVTDTKNIAEQVFVIVYQGHISGIIGFKGIDYINYKVEIGYWLAGNLQGQGIMRRCCKALVQYAFEDMRMNRIQIKVGVGNHRSSNIPKKLGFVLEGVQRDGELLNGAFHDLEIYSLLQREFKADLDL